MPWAKRLPADWAVPCYNRQIIDQTAQQMGYSTEFVEKNEQTLSTGRLWELICTDSGIPASLNPSKEDAIYVSQSRTIRGLAHNGPCVIIGRLGNWILRDDPHVLRVFIRSSRDFAVKQIVDKLHLSEEEAAKKIERVNTGSRQSLLALYRETMDRYRRI